MGKRQLVPGFEYLDLVGRLGDAVPGFPATRERPVQAHAFTMPADEFPCALTIDIPLPTHRLASSALRALQVDAELSPLVRRNFSLARPDSHTVVDGTEPRGGVKHNPAYRVSCHDQSHATGRGQWLHGITRCCLAGHGGTRCRRAGAHNPHLTP